MATSILDIVDLYPPFEGVISAQSSPSNPSSGFDILDVLDVFTPYKASSATTTVTVTGRPYLVNNGSTTLAQDHAPGDGSITVMPGTGSVFGSPTPSKWIGLTVIRGRSPLAIYQVTGRQGDTLTIGGMLDGTTDQPLRANDRIVSTVWAGLFDLIFAKLPT